MTMAHPNHYARQERFTCPIRAVKSLSTEGIWSCRLWTEWYSQNVSLINKTPELAKLAAQGVVKEGELLDRQVIAQEMADELRRCENDRRKLMECAVNLYTKDTFLYNVLNTALRNDDMSKVQTLGPLCFLINAYISRHTKLTEAQIIYRGMTLTEEMIQEYIEAVGEDIDWPAFTSTTKNPAVAEMFAGNTLCVITLSPGVFAHGADISRLSHMQHEEEFLLSVGFVLRVERVEVDPNNEKRLIYLNTVFESEEEK